MAVNGAFTVRDLLMETERLTEADYRRVAVLPTPELGPGDCVLTIENGEHAIELTGDLNSIGRPIRTALEGAATRAIGDTHVQRLLTIIDSDLPFGALTAELAHAGSAIGLVDAPA